jgi:hypothetical protein
VLKHALALTNPEQLLAEPSAAVDWRVPVERRERGGDRREESRIPVASAAPPPPTPPRNVPDGVGVL